MKTFPETTRLTIENYLMVINVSRCLLNYAKTFHFESFNLLTTAPCSSRISNPLTPLFLLTSRVQSAKQDTEAEGGLVCRSASSAAAAAPCPLPTGPNVINYLLLVPWKSIFNYEWRLICRYINFMIHPNPRQKKTGKHGWRVRAGLKNLPRERLGRNSLL